MAEDEQVTLIEGLRTGRRVEDLIVTEREGALIRYGDKLTKTPAAIRREDIEPLRRAGLDDRAIHDACAIVAYFAFVNRIADGLGVELEGKS
jgi:uncharacterized peroxidase-related enzyme